MTTMTPHPTPDVVLAGIRPPADVVPRYDLSLIRSDAQCHAGRLDVSVPADRLGLHLDPDGFGWLTVEHPAAAGPVFTLLGLDDVEGRRQALAVLTIAVDAVARGDQYGAAVLTVDHRGAAGAPTLLPEMVDHLTIVAASYLGAEGIEVRP